MTDNEQKPAKTAQLIRLENVGGSVFSVIEDITPDNGQDFTLEELQGYVGGLIEIVEIPNGHRSRETDPLLRMNPERTPRTDPLLQSNRERTESEARETDPLLKSKRERSERDTRTRARELLRHLD